MLDTKNPLIAEFLRDHQQMSRLLLSITQLLKENNLEQAQAKARELNQVAGPHIEYEECELYPRLAALGAEHVKEETLVGQHHEVVQAMQQLLDQEKLDAANLQHVIKGFESGLDHAEHCGSLISLMSRLSDEQQRESLNVLLRLRDEGNLWTELYRN